MSKLDTPQAGHKRTLGKTGTKETGNLLDESLRGKEGIVLLGKLLNKLLVLVKPANTKVSYSTLRVGETVRTSSNRQRTCTPSRFA